MSVCVCVCMVCTFVCVCVYACLCVLLKVARKQRLMCGTFMINISAHLYTMLECINVDLRTHTYTATGCVAFYVAHSRQRSMALYARFGVTTCAIYRSVCTYKFAITIVYFHVAISNNV